MRMSCFFVDNINCELHQCTECTVLQRALIDSKALRAARSAMAARSLELRHVLLVCGRALLKICLGDLVG